MDSLFIIIFWLGFAAMLVAVVAERFVVEGRLSRIRNAKLPIAFTQKARIKRLEDYKQEFSKGEEDLWYRYLQTINKHGTRYVIVMLVMGVLAFLF